MIPLKVFALCNLPLAGQRTLATEGGMYIRTAIARSGTTDIDIINMLVDDREELVYTAAMRRTTNKDRLETVCRETLATQANAASNPIAPTDFLISMLDNTTNPQISLRAYSNPGTPLEARQQLSPSKIRVLLEPDEDNGLGTHKQIRAFEIVAANPWMAETPDRWDAPILQAINCQKGGTATQLQTLRDPQFTLQDARIMLNKSIHLEPSIIGRLINRYGFGQLYADIAIPWGTDEFKSVTWVAPIVYHESGSRVWAAGLGQVIEACEILGDNEDAWQTFAGLASNWHGTLQEAIDAAFRL